MSGFKVQRINCDCHPETCCCSSYEIVNDVGESIARGNNKLTLDNLALSATYGILAIDEIEKLKDAIRKIKEWDIEKTIEDRSGFRFSIPEDLRAEMSNILGA